MKKFICKYSSIIVNKLHIGNDNVRKGIHHEFFLCCSISSCRTDLGRKYKLDNPCLIAAYTSAAMSE